MDPINLRVGYAQLGGDEESQRRYEAMVEEARRRMTTELAVAPGQRLLGRNGWLESGAEVRVDDILGRDDAHGFVPPHAVLRTLVAKGIVLEAEHQPPTPTGSST